MFYRIKQFCLAWTAKITEADKSFLNQYLSTQEKELFNRLNKATQKHSILVAQAALKAFGAATETSHKKDELKILVKAALLHDIGKSMANLNVFHKTLYVLLKRFMPKLLQKLTSRENSPFCNSCSGLAKAMYVAENHAAIGAAMADKWGLDKDLAQIIANHHTQSNSPLSELIRKIDEQF